MFGLNLKTKIAVTDQEFAVLFAEHGAEGVAAMFKVGIRRVYERRKKVEAALGVQLAAPPPNGLPSCEKPRQDVTITDGIVLVGSDGHYWPGQISTAHRAFCLFAKKLKPKVIIFNGDALDAPTISRHPPIGWENLPSLAQELECVQERMGEIEKASGKAVRYWPLGNHDARFNTRLAQQAPEFRSVPGTRLVHHFPLWEPCWAVYLGGERGAVVKHRFKGGMYAPQNNALWAGRTILTGHLHSQKIMPITVGGETRWGVDTGCLADPNGPQFNYAEENPLNWRSGFCVLTWRRGVLLPPELVTVLSEQDGTVIWRGEVIEV